MHIFLSAVVLLSGQGTLDSYHLYMGQIYLDSLYADSLADLQFPAYMETSTWSCSCSAGFRGGTSLLCPKKSWKIELQDPTLANASHILLDAQYRDHSLMRNVLGLMLSRKLGFPAPQTNYVEFYINDVYYGVYVQVERIDDYFYNRNNIGNGPLFKAVNHLSRFVWQPSNPFNSSGYEAKQGSDEYLPLLRSLVDEVNLRSPLSINVQDFISNAAISLAIRDQDAITKNFYLHLTGGDTWRYFPWDRDASFGNRWNGEYEPEWVEKISMFCFTISPLLTTLLMDNRNRIMFEDYMLEIADIMKNDLPAVIDSIYLEIRTSVYADTMKQGTNADFDEAVEILRSSTIERAEFLPEIAEPPVPLEVESMTLSQWDFRPGGSSDSVTVTVEFESPPDHAAVNWWSDESDIHYIRLNQVGSSGLIWSRTIAFPSQLDHIEFAVIYYVETKEDMAVFYYPYYGIPVSSSRKICVPTVRRSEISAHIEEFSILRPIRYTPFLWSIPIVNTSSSIQNISYFGFQAGDPPARLFAPAGIFISPGDTMYLTNNEQLLSSVLPENSILGNLVLDSPAGTELQILDPSWTTAATVTLGEETPCGESNPSVILSEICYSGEGGDWIELFNIGLRVADLSGDILIDGVQHSYVIPDNVNIEPGECLIICESYDLFNTFYEPYIRAIQADKFKLNSIRDGISLMHGDELVFSVMYDRSTWPMSDNCVLSLISPELPLADASSWVGVDLPGTPGAPNPGWPTIVLIPVIKTLLPNPVLSSFTIDYLIPDVPGELFIYDISGRLVTQPVMLGNFEGTALCELPLTLRPGVYFAVIRSRGAVASGKFVLLR